jgi:two-component system, OmpR family, sensor kinase
MRTPSLRRRVTFSGLVVFVGLVLLLDLVVYVALRVQLEDTLAEVLASRIELVSVLDETLEDDAELATRLAARGVPAVVTSADGERFVADPVTRVEAGPPSAPDDTRLRRISESVELTSGGSVEVLVSRNGADRTLRRTLLAIAIGTVVAIVAAVALFRRSAALAVAPLDQVAAAARRTAAGRTGERLDPDETDTELGRLAVAYDDMLDNLEDALERATDAEARTRRFVDDAAHQLRTPLATTRASVEALLRERDPEVRDLLLASLVREVSRSDRLLTSLLTLARLDAGAPAIRRPTDLVALCRDEVERARSLVPGIEVQLTATGTPVDLLELDEHAVREAVANLLDNARRHAASRIEVVVRGGAAAAWMEVHDDGPGLDPDAVDRAFQRFASLDGGGGSGLGLPIARAVAEAHGGTLEHDGSAFVLCLPAAAQDRSSVPARS